MDRPSDFWQLMQAYVVVAVGVLAIIVMFDAKTRRDQENRLALILGHSGCPKAFDYSYLKKESGKLAGDSKKAYKQGKKLVSEGYRVHRQERCDPFTDITCGLLPASEITEGYGVYDDTACQGRAPGTRIQCNLSSNNNLHYYEGYGDDGYMKISDKDDMDN